MWCYVYMGEGVAIGAVFASEKYVCPNAVGVDIGCGIRKGTDGVCTNGIAANRMLFDRGTFGVLPLIDF